MKWEPQAQTSKSSIFTKYVEPISIKFWGHDSSWCTKKLTLTLTSLGLHIVMVMYACLQCTNVWVLSYLVLCPGIITSSGRMIGERLSASGTRLDTGSPVAYVSGGNKSSTESLKPRTLKSVSRQSLLDIVSCRLGVGRSKQHQVILYLVILCVDWCYKHKLCPVINSVINNLIELFNISSNLFATKKNVVLRYISYVVNGNKWRAVGINLLII